MSRISCSDRISAAGSKTIVDSDAGAGATSGTAICLRLDMSGTSKTSDSPAPTVSGMTSGTDVRASSPCEPCARNTTSALKNGVSSEIIWESMGKPHEGQALAPTTSSHPQRAHLMTATPQSKNEYQKCTIKHRWGQKPRLRPSPHGGEELAAQCVGHARWLKRPKPPTEMKPVGRFGRFCHFQGPAQCAGVTLGAFFVRRTFGRSARAVS